MATVTRVVCSNKQEEGFLLNASSTAANRMLTRRRSSNSFPHITVSLPLQQAARLGRDKVVPSPGTLGRAPRISLGPEQVRLIRQAYLRRMALYVPLPFHTSPSKPHSVRLTRTPKVRALEMQGPYFLAYIEPHLHPESCFHTVKYLETNIVCCTA